MISPLVVPLALNFDFYLRRTHLPSIESGCILIRNFLRFQIHLGSILRIDPRLEVPIFVAPCFPTMQNSMEHMSAGPAIAPPIPQILPQYLAPPNASEGYSLLPIEYLQIPDHNPPSYDETMQRKSVGHREKAEEKKEEEPSISEQYGFTTIEEDAGDAPSAPIYDAKALASSVNSIRSANNSREMTLLPMPLSVPMGLVWQLDAEAPECGVCGRNFSFFVRRSHCRFCGSVICSDCNSFCLVPKLGTDNVRICSRCASEDEYIHSCFVVHNGGNDNNK